MPLFLAFTQEGAGHYDSLVQAAERTAQQSEQIKGLRCRRGVNSKDPNSRNCCVIPITNSDQKRKCSSRCKCLKAGLKCGEKCKCKNCGNGRKSVKISSRKSHKDKFVRKSFSQQYTTPEAFLLKRETSHNVRLGFSILELMILESCVLYMILKGGYKNVEKVAEIFNCCIDHYNCNNKNQTLVKRSIKEIRKQMDKPRNQNKKRIKEEITR